jgi:hypothetical protein
MHPMKNPGAVLLTIIILSFCALASLARGAQPSERGALRGEAGKQATSKSSKPDFNGTWVLDHAKSYFGRMGQRMADVNVTLYIWHKEPELRITRKLEINGGEQARDFTYFSDGRGETNPNVFSNGEVKSKTKWEGLKLVSKASTSFQAPRTNEVYFTDTTEKRELSGDGKTLTITLSISGQRGTENIRQVFNRAA